jgi:hypothetical protein
MSDVTVAPSGGAPSAAPSEVAVDTNQAHSPNPVGSQAPDKPIDDAANRRETIRQNIQAAADRASRQQEDGARRDAQRRQDGAREAPRAADARPGHNNPPEQTPRERPPQPREQGRFASANAPANTPANARNTPPANLQGNSRVNSAGSNAPANTPRDYERLPEHAPYRVPIRRMSDESKAVWAQTPEPVRADIHRMSTDFAKHYQSVKNDLDAYKPLRQYHELAESQGTTLERALQNYVSMEAKLREDVVGGLDVIVRNLNLRGPEGEPLGLRDVAYHILNMSPDQHRLTQQQNQQVAAQHQIGALHQEIAGLKNYLQQVHTQQRYAQTRSGVDAFAQSHPRFDELGDLIEQEIKLGFPLEDAYRRAELLRPGHTSGSARTTGGSARTADRSITGAPNGGSNGASMRSRGSSPTPENRRDNIMDAIRAVRGGV